MKGFPTLIVALPVLFGAGLGSISCGNSVSPYMGSSLN